MPNFDFQVGRKPGKPCSHYYPDVLRNYDELSPSGGMILRHCYCFRCKKEYILKFQSNKMFNDWMDFGNKRTMEQLQRIREQEWKRLSKDHKAVKEYSKL